MPESSSNPSRVLFVDDDPSFLQMIRDVFGNASQGAWDIQTATTGGGALQQLRSKRMDLAVIDVFMPVMDGLQLLRMLNEEFPSLPKVLLTGMPDGNTRAAALEGGAALFLEKPSSADGYESVFATLNELLRWHQRFSSLGTLRRLGLLDLVKLECKSGNSRLFEVFAGDVRGEIYIKEGVIIHAMMPDRRGQSAFTYLTTAADAVFYLRQYVEPIERSVDREWEFLVMESAHVLAQLAEMPAEPESEPPPSEPAPPAAPAAAAPALKPPPPAPAAAPAPPVAPAASPVRLPEVTAQPNVLRAPAPGPTTLELQAAGGLNLDEAPEGLPFETVLDPAGFKIEELLLCTDNREVLHELACADTSRRMRLAEALFDKAQTFATQLPLGDVERLELNSTAGRMVIRFDARRCLLLRTNTRFAQPVGDPQATLAAEHWLKRLPMLRGVLAASVVTPDGQLHHRSFVSEFPRDLTQLVVREASRLPELALKNLFPAWLVRVLYSQLQLYVFRRQDGLLLIAFLLRSGMDEVAAESFFQEFATVQAV